MPWLYLETNDELDLAIVLATRAQQRFENSVDSLDDLVTIWADVVDWAIAVRSKEQS